MLGFLLAVTSCSIHSPYGGLNQGGWITINAILILTMMVIGALLYAISAFFPVANREKLRNVVRYEAVEGVIAVVLILSLIGLSSVACSVGSSLSSGISGYTDPFQFSQYYLGNLLFAKGVVLTTQFFSTEITFVANGLVAEYFVNVLGQGLNGIGSLLSGVAGLSTRWPWLQWVTIGFHINTPEPLYIFYGYGSIFTGLLAPLMIITFGILFILFLFLPLVQNLAFNIIIPVAIIMRALSFTGPRLRDASNTFIALSLAFYFILPLTLGMDNFIVNWLYCMNGVSPPGCNPYASPYLAPYAIADPAPDKFFTTNEFKTITSLLSKCESGLCLYDYLKIPLNFWAYYVQNNEGSLVNLLTLYLGQLLTVPGIIDSYIYKVSQYLFQGIVLMALDMAITVGFAIGLTKGLNAVSHMMGSGPFFGGSG